jgi:mono/diheme cytochrome c family protein
MRFERYLPYVLATVLSVGFAPAAAAADDESPREVFERVGCWSCHGYEGQGGRHGPTIARTQHNYEAFSAFVRTTSGEMPPFTERVVSDQDLRAIYAYLQSRSEPPSPEGFSLLQGVFPE